MPVIPQLSQLVKLGKTASGGMPAEASATIDAISQAQIAGPSLQPIPFLPGLLPVIPFGIPISIIMTKIEAMMFKSFEDLSALTKQLMEKYNQDLEKAKTQREQATNKLYNDLQIKQQEIKDELLTLKEELQEAEKNVIELKNEQESEMEKYTQVIFEIKDQAKKAELEGNVIERDRLVETISNHDDWLAEIIQISVEIITLELRITSLKNEIEDKKYLAELKIPKIWETDVELADLFEVPVPSHPDLPAPPILPNSPPIPKESEFVKALRKSFGKWIVAPTVLPLGIPLAAILLYIQSLATAPPQLAAQLESQADASILQGGGCF